MACAACDDGLITKKLLVRVRAFGVVICHGIGTQPLQETIMKIWNKPQVREQAVGMEVTAYLPADIDLI